MVSIELVRWFASKANEVGGIEEAKRWIRENGIDWSEEFLGQVANCAVELL